VPLLLVRARMPRSAPSSTSAATAVAGSRAAAAGRAGVQSARTTRGRTTSTASCSVSRSHAMPSRARPRRDGAAAGPRRRAVRRDPCAARQNNRSTWRLSSPLVRARDSSRRVPFLRRAQRRVRRELEADPRPFLESYHIFSLHRDSIAGDLLSTPFVATCRRHARGAVMRKKSRSCSSSTSHSGTCGRTHRSCT